MRHLSFPSIDQFRNTIKTVRERAAFHKIPVPSLTFTGSVKLHGTNAGVVMDVTTGEIWAQSREQLINVDNDNAGFARFMTDRMDTFKALLGVARMVYGTHKTFQEGTYIGIYGEWCGKGILKGCAIHQLEKMFVIFGIAVITPAGVEGDMNSPDDRVWFTPTQVNDVLEGLFGNDGASKPANTPIFSIFHMPTWEMKIDFNRPEEVQNQLVALTDLVEKECPVGKHFGVSGVGEGIVWKCYEPGGWWNLGEEVRTNDLCFKVKGAKHSESKTKQTAPVDIEKVRSINEFVDKVVTDNRLQMVVEKMKAESIEVDVKTTGEFLKRVGADVLKEEDDTIKESGLERKDVMPAVNRHARNWFMTMLNSQVGLAV